MISVEQACALVQQYLPDWGSEARTLSTPAGGIAAEELRADREYPPIDRVMMDGIAVSWSAFREGLREYRVAAVCAAGDSPVQLPDLTSCFEVMTGAPLPIGAGLVIPYEDLEMAGALARVGKEVPRTHLEFVHRKGSDVAPGAVVLPFGAELDGPAWGIAASVGALEIKVKRRPRVLVVSTGDELVTPEMTPLPHQLRRSNAYALRASLLAHGYSKVELAHLRDDPVEIETHFITARQGYELLIYSGGVSKGKFDYLPSVWKRAGVKEVFHGVSQRPGKPLWFGVHEEAKVVVLGLPGNPVSSLVCLHRYLLAGRKVYAQLKEEIVFPKSLTYFVPARLEFSRDGTLLAEPLPVKNSGEFSGLGGSDGFLELPREGSRFAAGEAYPFYSWRPL